MDWLPVALVALAPACVPALVWKGTASSVGGVSHARAEVAVVLREPRPARPAVSSVGAVGARAASSLHRPSECRTAALCRWEIDARERAFQRFRP